jgi:hypothetical protein
MMWVIVRTEYTREKAVAAQIDKKGFPVWIPTQIITKRHPAARRHMDRSNVLETINRPVCPSLLFAAVPVDEIDRIMGIRHLKKVEQTAEGMWAVVPDIQVQIFREAIDQENRATAMLTIAAQRKQKKKWRNLAEGLLDLVAAVIAPVEQAA